MKLLFVGVSLEVIDDADRRGALTSMREADAMLSKTSDDRFEGLNIRYEATYSQYSPYSKFLFSTKGSTSMSPTVLY
jgi:hypothetical protein